MKLYQLNYYLIIIYIFSYDSLHGCGGGSNGGNESMLIDNISENVLLNGEYRSYIHLLLYALIFFLSIELLKFIM